jgi:hypothetical protein
MPTLHAATATEPKTKTKKQGQKRERLPTHQPDQIHSKKTKSSSMTGPSPANVNNTKALFFNISVEAKIYLSSTAFASQSTTNLTSVFRRNSSEIATQHDKSGTLNNSSPAASKPRDDPVPPL